MAIYDDIDLKWHWNGDFDISYEGDLGDTAYDALQSILQDIHTIAASSFNDWEIYPNYGATIDDFIGEANSRRTGNAIEGRLRLSLTSAGIENDDLDIRVVPIHANRVLIIIKLNALATPFNRLSLEEPLVTQLVFDSVEQNIFFLDKTPQLIGD